MVNERPILSVAAALLVAGIFAGVPAAGTEIEPAPGTFLVATRDLPDPNFRRTVVLLVGYGPGGAMGLVVNRPTEIPLASLFPDEPTLRDRADRVWLGGPVSRTDLLVLTRAAEEPEGLRRVFEDVFFGHGEQRIASLADTLSVQASLRVFAGYAGWAPGQLDAELDRGGWHLVRATTPAIFEADPEEVWERLLPADPTELAERRPP